MLGTIHAFLEEAARDAQKRVPVIAFVTPMHPKDWYNARQSSKHRAYLESWFVGVYHRSLSELVRSAINNRPAGSCPPVIQRYILSFKGSQEQARASSAKDILGWQLESDNELGENLKKWRILDVAVPVKVGGGEPSWPVSGCKFCGKLRDLYLGYVGLVKVKTPRDLESSWHVVPLWNPEWKKTAHIDGLGQDEEALKLAIKDVPDSICDNCECAQRIVEFARNEALKKFEDAKNELLAEINAQSKSLATPLRDAARKYMAEAKDSDEYWKLVSTLQHVDARLGEKKPDLKLEKLLMSLLRYRSAKDATWKSLHDVFTAKFHSSATEAKYIGLTSSDLDEWKTVHADIEGEFALFGFQCGKKEVEWKWVVATALEQPFHVAKMKASPHVDKYSATFKWLTQKCAIGDLGTNLPK